MLYTPVREIVQELPDGEELVLQIVPPSPLADPHERTVESRGPVFVDYDDLEESR